jgi:hypothetical protein
MSITTISHTSQHFKNKNTPKNSLKIDLAFPFQEEQIKQSYIKVGDKD